MVQTIPLKTLKTAIKGSPTDSLLLNFLAKLPSSMFSF